MRRLSMKSKKGKVEANDETHEDELTEEQGNGESNAAVSEEESAASEDKIISKRKNKRGKKKSSSNADAEDGGSDSKKRKKDVPEPEEPEEYEVDIIVDMKQVRGKRQFKIRWKGYGPENDSWENEEDLSCPEIIKAYLETADDKVNSKSKKRGGKGASKTPKKKAKTNENSTSSGNESEDETKEYEVDKVMEVHFKKNGTREFLIHWKGFSHKDDTWEPESNLNCPELIEKFMSRVDKAKSSGNRELRANPQHTERFTLNMTQSGRRLSRRNQGRQRAKYHDAE